MPFLPRATAFVTGFGMIAAFGIGGCGGNHATGFCARIKQGHAAFDSIAEAQSTRALRQFDRVVASAPAAVAPDLKTVSTVLSLLYRNPKAVADDPALFKQFTSARDHIDQYLRRACGIRIPQAADVKSG